MLTDEPLEVRRGELLARLERGRPKIVVLIAPAGFGKSTLVRQYVAERGPAAVCDCSGLRDELDLARRLLPALAALAPERERVLTRRELQLGDGSVAERLDIAVRSWTERADGCFVFENAEAVAGCPPARDLLGRLLGAIPEGRRVVICSRENLRLHLTRYAAPHEITLLRAADLAFDALDVRAIFAPVADDPRLLQRVLDVSQGWPIAVLLLKRFATEGRAEALLDRLGDVAFEQLRDYLVDHVLASLDEALVRAIVACVCIPRATLADLRVAFDDHRVLAALETLAADSPFVERNADGSFRVHPLLASLLLGENDARRRDVLAEVAERYERAGDFERAAELHLERGDQRAAARVLGRHEVALDRSPSMAYARVLASLDHLLIQRYPRLWSVTCLLRTFCVPTADLLDEAESVRRMLSPGASPFERFYVFVFRVLLLTYAGQLDDAAAAIEEFVRDAADERGEPPASLAAWILYLGAVVAARQGRLAQAERDFTAALPVVSTMDVMASGTFVTLGADVARARGERALERQFIDHGIDLARNSTLTNFVALGLCEAAFGAWLAGEEESFVRFSAALADCVERSGVHGLAFFSAVASGRDAEPLPSDALRSIVYGRLIDASRCADDAEALQRAHAALEAAERYDSPLLEALAACAVALCDEAAQDAWMRRATAAAARCDAAPLHAAVGAVARRAPESGFLAPFVARFERDRRRHVAALEVRLANGTVFARGREARLAGREAALLFALALRREATPRAHLASMLWPELDAEAAANALSVCLHRLRRSIGTEAVVRDASGYRLREDAMVDLWQLERVVTELRGSKRLTDDVRAAIEALAGRLDAVRPPRMDEWEWFETAARRLDALRVDAAHRLAGDALDRNDFGTALDRALEIAAFDPFDEPAREIAIRAYVALGDRAAAVRLFRQYRDLLAAELQIEPSPVLSKLVYA